MLVDTTEGAPQYIGLNIAGQSGVFQRFGDLPRQFRPLVAQYPHFVTTVPGPVATLPVAPSGTPARDPVEVERIRQEILRHEMRRVQELQESTAALLHEFRE
jgi:hypothetical protein